MVLWTSRSPAFSLSNLLVPEHTIQNYKQAKGRQLGWCLIEHSNSGKKSLDSILATESIFLFDLALQRAEMRMVRCMCGVKLKDRLPSKELRERLGVDDIALVLQQNRLRRHGHVLRKDDDDWVKKCMEHEVEGSRPRGRPKKTWKEVVCEDCQHVS